MSKLFITTLLLSSLIPGLAFAKQHDNHLLDEDRYLYAQPDALPTPASPAHSQPVFGAPSDREDAWRSNANGS